MSIKESGVLRFGKLLGPNFRSDLEYFITAFRSEDGGASWSDDFIIMPAEADFGPLMFPKDHEMDFIFNTSYMYRIEVKSREKYGSLSHSAPTVASLETHLGQLIQKSSPMSMHSWEFSNGVSVEIGWTQVESQPGKTTIHRLSAKNVPKAGFFAGKPESAISIVDADGNEIARTPVQWDDNDPEFPALYVQLKDLTKGNESGDFGYKLLNYDEKKKGYEEFKFTTIGQTSTNVGKLSRLGLFDKEKLDLVDTSGKKVKPDIKVGFQLVPHPSVARRLWQAINGYKFSYGFYIDFAKNHKDIHEDAVKKIISTVYSILWGWSNTPQVTYLTAFNTDKGLVGLGNRSTHQFTAEKPGSAATPGIIKAYTDQRGSLDKCNKEDYAGVIDLIKQHNSDKNMHVAIMICTGKPDKETRPKIDKALAQLSGDSNQEGVVFFIGIGDNAKKWHKHYNRHRNDASAKKHNTPCQLSFAIEYDSHFNYKFSSLLESFHAERLIAQALRF